MLERVGDRFVDVREEDNHRAEGWAPKFYDLTLLHCLSARPSPFWPSSGKPRCVDGSGRAVRV